MAPPRSVPSHSSVASRTPLPQSEQAASLNATQLAAPDRVPLSWPSPPQVWPPRSVPSHSSDPSRRPLPQVEQPDPSNTQVPVHDSEPPLKPSETQVAPPRLAPSHCSPGPMTPSGQVGGGVVQTPPMQLCVAAQAVHDDPHAAGFDEWSEHSSVDPPGSGHRNCPAGQGAARVHRPSKHLSEGRHSRQ